MKKRTYRVLFVLNIFLVIFIAYSLVYKLDVLDFLSNIKEDNDITFVDVTELSGIERMSISDFHAWGDFNNDSYPDLVITRHGQTPLLYLNNGDGTFSNVLSLSGVEYRKSKQESVFDMHGCAWADFDNDGDQDFYISHGSWKGKGFGFNQLYKNNGKGVFVDVAKIEGVTDERGRGRNIAWADYDNDGNLDLFVGNEYGEGVSDALFHNEGNGTFKNEKPKSGLMQHSDSLYGIWADFNGDGFMDLSTFSNNDMTIRLYKNNQNKKFTLIKTISGRGFTWGDFNNDGKLDLLVIRDGKKSGKKLHILLLNKGNGAFEDYSERANLRFNMEVGKTAIAGDYDNDGDLDAFLLNTDASHLSSGNKNFQNFLYSNNGDGSFTEVSSKVGLNKTYRGVGSGVTWVDYDNDGFVDIFLTNGHTYPKIYPKPEDPQVLLTNSGNSNNWLKIRLVGTITNRDGTGAKILIESKGKRQFREQNGGGVGYAQTDKVIHVGLGKDSKVEKLTVEWPSGIVQTFEGIRANQVITITESKSYI